jgi:hypothetical protein
MFTLRGHYIFVSLSSFIDYSQTIKTEVIMKTLKIAMVAALVACTMISLANTDGFKEKPKAVKIVYLTLEKAVQVPGLAAAMYFQIDKEELLSSPSAILVANVTFQGVHYRISGTRDQWVRFFSIGTGIPGYSKPKVIWMG